MDFVEELKKSIQQGIDLAKKNVGANVYVATGNQVGTNAPNPQAVSFTDAAKTAGSWIGGSLLVTVLLIGGLFYLIFGRKK